MQIIRGSEHFKPHITKIPGSYEWWYFDFIDNKNEYSAVVIFLAGCPFSPDYSVPVYLHSTGRLVDLPEPLNFSAISVNIYLKQRIAYRTLFEFSKENFSFQEDDKTARLTIGNSTVIYEKESRSYSLDMNYSQEKYGKRIRIEMSFSPVADFGSINFKEEKSSQFTHYWNPSSPACNASFKMVSYVNEKRKKTELTGLGYADHNWGMQPLFDGIEDWYWGRVVSNEYALVYYFVRYGKPSNETFATILLYENGELVYSDDKFPFEVKKARNYWMLGYGELLKGSKDDLSVRCNNEKLIDNGPFYVRSLAEFDVDFKGRKIFEKATGISEYIYPKRLGSSFLKNFVKLRIKRIS